MSIFCIKMSWWWLCFIPHLCILLPSIQIFYYCIIVCTIQFYNDLYCFLNNWSLSQILDLIFTANELRFLEGSNVCQSKWSCVLVWSIIRTHKHASDWSVMILGCRHSFLNFMEPNLGDTNIYYNNINYVYWRNVFYCLKLFKCRSYLWLWLCIPVCNDPERLSMLIFGRSCMWICQ
jgi:hypothetical protein